MTMKASLYLVIAISLCVVVLQWPIPASEGQTQEETNKVRLDEKSLYIDTQSVSFRILGEVVNETEFIISARVIVTAKDVNGKVRCPCWKNNICHKIACLWKYVAQTNVMFLCKGEIRADGIDDNIIAEAGGFLIEAASLDIACFRVN